MKNQEKGMPEVYEIRAPEYVVTQDCVVGHESAGRKIDDLITLLFGNRHLLMRGVSSVEHGTSLDHAVEEILDTGWDRNHAVPGKGYSKVDCDIFAWAYNPTKRLPSSFPLWKAWEGNVTRGNIAHRWDVLVLYDPDKLDCVHYEYKWRMNNDAFRFKDVGAKPEAVLAVIKLTS
jgi:hypothetical protein